MKTLTTFASALVMAFVLSGPAHAMDEIFENINTDWLGDGSFELIEDLSFNPVTPAHAIGDLGSCVFAECEGREDEYIGDFLLPADAR
ncbi:MAG: hypothetical protein V6Z81_04400 [Parvularculales bacterium]